MTLVVLLGGARSGKSRLACELASHSGQPVTFIATAEARDEEMRTRIEAHRAERPRVWQTVEEPYRLAHALAGLSDDRAVIVDCLALWVANALERGDQSGGIMETARSTAGIARARPGLTVAVSNEVGLGVVPATPLGRRFRDVLGSVNRIWVDEADRAVLVVAGRALPLMGAVELLRDGGDV